MSADDDNVIRFPGGDEPDANGEQNADASNADGDTSGLGRMLGIPLSPQQEKALNVVLSGMSFVCVGIKPTGGGADFFTAVHGEAQDLGDALPHLQGVIERAFRREGLV